MELKAWCRHRGKKQQVRRPLRYTLQPENNIYFQSKMSQCTEFLFSFYPMVLSNFLTLTIGDKVEMLD